MVEDLEPAITSSLVGASICDLLQVNGTGTLVAAVKTLLGRVIGPRTDLKRKEGAILDRLDAGDSLGTTDI